MALKLPMAAATSLLFVAVLLPSLHPTEAQIGVCYGMVGDNLPSEQDVVNLYKSNGIGAMRIYNPDQATLQAVHGSGISLIVGVPNGNLQSLASDPSAAMLWVQTNVVPFASSIKYIAVGNEVRPTDEEAPSPSVGPAMQNILNAVNFANLGVQIKVSTSIDMALITYTFPPSAGTFSNMSYITPIVNFLTSNGSPLLANFYPYFLYLTNKFVDINYALLTRGTMVTDTGNQLHYNSLFDAQVDSLYAALANIGAPNMTIVVSESGWPSDGGDSATVHNAQTYYSNLIGHVKRGTPLKPGPIETYLFAMFDEDLKVGLPTEQHYGLFTPAQKPKYQLTFN